MLPIVLRSRPSDSILNLIPLIVLFFAPLTHLSAQEHVENFEITKSNDGLILNYSSEADSVHFEVIGGSTIKLTQNAEEVWSAKLESQNPDSLLFSYLLSAFFRDSEPFEIEDKWVGEDIVLFTPANEMKGFVTETDFHSKALDETRILTLYLPEVQDPSEVTKVVYLTDGDVVTKYAPFVDQLITDQRIEKTVLVGIHNGTTEAVETFDISKDPRSLEYLEGLARFVPDIDTLFFENHMNFFTSEVTEFLKSDYELETSKEDRIIYGKSNGAAFSASALRMKPEYFSAAILGSFGWDLVLMQNYPKTESNADIEILLSAGTFEPDFYASSIQLSKLLTESGYEVDFTTYYSGHHEIFWQNFFLNSLIQLNPKD